MDKAEKREGFCAPRGNSTVKVTLPPPPLGARRYYTTSQLMRRWGVSAPTIIRLIEEGQLQGLKIRGVYRVAKDSVESYEKKVSF